MGQAGQTGAFLWAIFIYGEEMDSFDMIPVVQTYINPVFILECLLQWNISTEFKPPTFFSHSHCVYLNAISNSVILDSKHTLLHNNTRFAGRK